MVHNSHFADNSRRNPISSAFEEEVRQACFPLPPGGLGKVGLGGGGQLDKLEAGGVSMKLTICVAATSVASQCCSQRAAFEVWR